jgi:exopolysaccharide biosynthesis polyprenyl glycosylphosphotransferase
MSSTAVSQNRAESDSPRRHSDFDEIQFQFERAADAGWWFAKLQRAFSRLARPAGADGEPATETARVLIVGMGRVGQALAQHCRADLQPAYEVIGFLDENGSSDPAVLGTPEDLLRVAHQHFIDEVFLTTPPDSAITGRLWSQARRARLNMSLVEAPQNGSAHNGNGAYAVCYPVVQIHRRPERLVAAGVKRALDVFLGGALLILLSPLMLAVALAIKLGSQGNVLYCSRRMGQKGREFPCYKFRTMVSDAHSLRAQLMHLNEYEKVLFKIRSDPRVTRLGKFLRKYSLDELPQLWNVLAGDMSLVGPRPPLPEEYAQYEIRQRRRLQVKPGITGLWQVTARQNPCFDTYMKLDLDYVKNWNLWWDLKILLKTIPAVARGTGV